MLSVVAAPSCREAILVVVHSSFSTVEVDHEVFLSEGAGHFYLVACDGKDASAPERSASFGSALLHVANFALPESLSLRRLPGL